MMDTHGNPAVFLDRDGVINVDKGYVHKQADFEWMPGAREAIKYANENGFLVIVVTNQSGIARGYYTEADVKALHRWMNKHLAECGARIDAFYYSPYHPDGTIREYRRVSDCRKPGPGMLLQAFADRPIDKARSFLIGDNEKDMAAAAQAGIRGHLFAGGDLCELLMDCIQASSRANSS
jgi:D-glycero-D-manno-heptose 1,7-bisphosphate phosphatase